MGETQEALSLSSIRAIAASGDLVMPATTLALCDRLEAAGADAAKWQRQASLWAENIEDLIRERDGLRGRVGALEEAARGLLDACAVAWTKAGDETMYLSDAELHMGKVLGGGGVALHALVIAARAWAGAIERVDGIAAAEQRLLEAIRECES